MARKAKEKTEEVELEDADGDETKTSRKEGKILGNPVCDFNTSD